jgi:hypothetical protein
MGDDGEKSEEAGARLARLLKAVLKAVLLLGKCGDPQRVHPPVPRQIRGTYFVPVTQVP